MYREFWRTFAKEYGRLRMVVLICVVTIAVSLFEGLNIGLLVPLLETLSSPAQGEEHWISRAFASTFNTLGIPFKLETILGALAIFILGVATLKYLRAILVGKTVANFVVWMRSKTMSNLLDADMSYFHREKLGTLTDTLTTQATRAGDSLYYVTELIATITLIVTYLVVGFLVSYLLTLAAFGMLLIVSLAMQYYITRAKIMGVQRVQRENDLQAAAVESLSGVKVIKSFLLEPIRRLTFETKAREVGEVTYFLHRNQSRILGIQEVALFGLIGVIVFVGVSVLRIEVAVILALLFILYRMTPRVVTSNTLRHQLASTMPSLRSVKMIMEETAIPKVVSGEKHFQKLQRGIELTEVSFSYDGGGEVLRDTNLTIEKGKMTAVVGTSGVGKSTLMDLILRYYDPARGSIRVDGVDLRELDLISWRRCIGVVSQDIFLFNDTIMNNIAMGRPDASMDDITEAAQRAYAHEFIQELPSGYETQAGDRGWNLSGGQRQRIALARAILKRPEILILDEATSSLDSESEQLIQNYISEIRGTCTIMVVAHRMSTIQNADKIAVLQDGKIVEEGDWNSLLTDAGVFAKYHRLQLGDR